MIKVAENGGANHSQGVEPKVQPQLERILGVKFELGGELNRRLRAITNKWILPATMANPAILAMFKDSDTKPCRELVIWAGEFAGKYLTHAVQILRLTADNRAPEGGAS